MEDRRFTDTELPVFSGEEEGWYRHIHIVQAIKISNGWSDETAALQLSERGGVRCGSFVK